MGQNASRFHRRRLLRSAAVNGALVLALVGGSACGIMSGGSGLTAGNAPASPAVLASIPIGGYGGDVAVSADGSRAYVPLRTGKVIAVDTTSRQVAATIATNGQPYAIALTPSGTRAYATDMTGQYVLALDLADHRVLQSIPIGTISRPILTPAIAISRDGTRAYVTEASNDDDRLLVVDTTSNDIVGNQVLPIHPAGVAVSPDGRLVYVAGCKLACITGTLLVIDAASTNVVAQIPLPAAPDGVVLAPDGARAYVANGPDATVGVIDLTTKAVSRIAVDAQPIGIAPDPHGRFIYVASFAAATVSVIDTRSAAVVRKITVNQGPRAIAVSPDGRFGYVTHSSPTCSVIDLQRGAGGRLTTRIVGRIGRGLALTGVAYLGLAYGLLPTFWRHYEHLPAMETMPKVTQGTDGLPGDPLNVALVGSEAEIQRAFAAASWKPADPITLRSSLAIAGSVVLDRPDPEAPVSNLLLFGRHQDLAFENEVGASASQRNHVRFWRTDLHADGGRLVWVGGASFDRGSGLSHTTGQITHHIAPDVDAERDTLMRALTTAGRLTARYDVTGIGPTLAGRNAGGDRYFSDGELAVGVLAPADAVGQGEVAVLENPTPVVIKNQIWSWLRPVLDEAGPATAPAPAGTRTDGAP